MLCCACVGPHPPPALSLSPRAHTNAQVEYALRELNRAYTAELFEEVAQDVFHLADPSAVEGVPQWTTWLKPGSDLQQCRTSLIKYLGM